MVTLGGEPLAAEMIFGGEFGSERVQMTSDEEGQFSGSIPREGSWKVYVEAPELEVRRTVRLEVEVGEGSGIARVEIDIPDNTIAGQVVDEFGEPVPEAAVTAFYPENFEVFSDVADEAGRFRFGGLAEGAVAFEAELQTDSRAKLISESTLLRVAEDGRSEDLRLVVRPAIQISGRILSAAGGVPGASVTAQPIRIGRANASVVVHQAATDVSGSFQLLAPPDVSGLEMIVMAPGHTHSLSRTTGLPEDPILIPVEQLGGRLVVQLDEPLVWDDPARPALLALHDGIRIAIPVLRQWATLNGERNLDPKRVVVPSLPAGDYRLCWVFVGDYLAMVGPGWSPPAGRCVGGYLSPYGELRLNMSSPKAAGASAQG